MAGLVQDKVALVTGAASGIGRASALLFASEGARVVVADVDAVGGAKTCSLIEERGGEASFVRTDVTDDASVHAAVRITLDTYGSLDCAHNNAGTSGAAGRIHELELEGWERTLAINLTGVFLCMRHELSVMLERGGGAIVNTSSGAGVVAAPGLGPYCASKHAVLGLTKTAALEYVKDNIRINAICPGSTDTPMLRAFLDADPAAEKAILATQPGGRLATPEEIGQAAVWLCSDRASFVTGESMLVDGGAVAR